MLRLQSNLKIDDMDSNFLSPLSSYPRSSTWSQQEFTARIAHIGGENNNLLTVEIQLPKNIQKDRLWKMDFVTSLTQKARKRHASDVSAQEREELVSTVRHIMIV